MSNFSRTFGIHFLWKNEADAQGDRLFHATVARKRPKAGTEEERLWDKAHPKGCTDVEIGTVSVTADELSSVRRFRIAFMRKTGLSFPPVSSEEFDMMVHVALSEAKREAAAEATEEAGTKGAAPAE